MTGNVQIEATFGSNVFVMAFQPNGKARSAARWGGAEDAFASGESIAISPDRSIVVAGNAGAPPYAFVRAAKGAKTPNALVVTPEGTVTIPPGPVGVPAAVPGIPNGSQTFGGVTDAVMLRMQP